MKHWNFGQSRHISLSLDDFLDEKDAAGFKFFAGKEPWLVGIQKITRSRSISIAGAGTALRRKDGR
jgi:hypothetical protein